MKKITNLGVILLCSVALVACGGGGDSADSTNEVTVTSNSSSQVEEVQVTTTESTKEETPVGKRTNPVPLGHTATFDTIYYAEDGTPIDANISMTVSNPIRGQAAYDYLLQVNEYNEPAPEGKEWLLFDASMKMNKGSQDEPYYATDSFIPVSSNGEEVAQDTYPTLNETDYFGDKEVYEGGQLTGKVALLVPVGDNTLVSFNDFDSKVFFSLS